MKWPPTVVAALADGVGRVDAQGVIQPENAAMGRLLAALGVGTLAELTMVVAAAGERDAFEQGDAVVLDGADCHWRVQRCGQAPAVWVVGSDITGAVQASSLVLAQARARRLLQFADSIVHDLCNHLNTGVGLAAHLRPFVSDTTDLRLLDDLTAGSRQGVDLLRAMVRLLTRDRATREWVDLRKLVGEGVAVIAKAARLQGAVVGPPDGVELRVRTVATQLLQALLGGLSCLLDQGASSVGTTIERHDRAIAGARLRSCVRVRLLAQGIDPEAAGTLVAVARVTPELLAKSSPLPSRVVPLAEAVLVLLRLGGELVVTARGDGVAFDYWLPAPATG